MHPNSTLIEHFYTCFAQRDHAGMIACYAPEVRFSDAVFVLGGNRVGAMWHMLCEGGSDLEIRFRDVEADDQRGTAHWEAHYTFSATGRKVHNVIEAAFTFENGLIVQHRDQFDFYRWSRMALGPIGWALGWTPMLRKRVQRMARKRLEAFLASHPQYKG